MRTAATMRPQVAPTDALTAYERRREEKIRANMSRMSSLGVQAAAAGVRDAGEGKGRKTGAKRPAEDAPADGPPRRSSRVKAPTSYKEQTDDEFFAAAAAAAAEQGTGAVAAVAIDRYAPGAAEKALPPIPADDSCAVPRDSEGRLVFKDHPEFRPNLTPQQCIRAGVFGGIYFHPRGGRPGILGHSVDVTHEEFPREWFQDAQGKPLPESSYRNRRYEASNNRYGVKAGQDQAFWEDKGWIHPQDPRGWFQWYCRFYQGRRTEDDERQIGRWAGVAGDKGRWRRNLVGKIVRANKPFDDASVSPVVRQTLLHWAYDLTANDFVAMAKPMVSNAEELAQAARKRQEEREGGAD
ncbi:unnamed protein product [Pedinophyceae sp. YPF-701]|nr:unnamed protein product [Pedinophyceae sp. YPF-701]